MARDKVGTAAKYDIVVDEQRVTTHSVALGITGTGRRVLELGCAAGHVTLALKQRGHHVVGVEIDPQSAEKARSIADHVVTADLDMVDVSTVVPERDFDVALLGDVLEHLRDPLTVLHEVASVLAPDGFIVLSVPNVAFHDVRMSLLDGEWNYQDDGLLDRTHLRFFTRASLFQLVRQADLAVTEFHRIERPPGSSNVRPTAPGVGTAVSDLVLLDPNATTYVFVVKLQRRSAEVDAIAAPLEAELDTAEHDALASMRSLAVSRQQERLEFESSRRAVMALHRSKVFRLALRVRRRLLRLRRR